MVVKLLKQLPTTGYNIYMDNYFTMQALFRHITSKLRQNAVGTARSNRIPKELVGKKKRSEAGKVVTMSTNDEGAPMTCVSWQDKCLVYFVSTKHDHELPLATVERRTGAVERRTGAEKAKKVR